MKPEVQVFEPGYALPVVFGIVFLALVRTSQDLAASDRTSYKRLQLCTLVGALIGAKVSVLFGDLLWPIHPLEEFSVVWKIGRSITGGLLFGFLTAELLKPVFRYKLPPNDRFAAALPFSIAIGRVGCLIVGCCRGIPWDGPWAIHYEDGVSRHPSAGYELLFHLTAGALLVLLYRKRMLRGRLFAVYLMVYGAFRFVSEPLRVTPELAFSLSAYQFLAFAMVTWGVWSLVRRLPIE